ncbi:putative RNA methyltransferase [Paenibacillus azoreducens]|uniref:putative RNA methyltransferase n=1 Tax=Paenibacillus azoreducens TaxID=116718 RepID=UPI0039F47911
MFRKEIASMRADLMALYGHIFRCPVCSGVMKMKGKQGLVCSANHGFDLSKDGYLHLLPNAKPTKYDKRLFEARRLIHASGYFSPLLEALVSGIAKSRPWPPSGTSPLSMLDAGCGEGSQLAFLQGKLSGLWGHEVLTVGADLAKAGIMTAAKGSSRIIWCVADLARSPFQDRTFDIIFNILSPSNYGEFQRLLTPNGLLVKVVPGPQYLQEFRQLLHGNGAPRRQAAFEETAALFAKHFPKMDPERVRYEKELPQRHLQAMLEMTPLSWHAPEEDKQLLLARQSLKLTFDFYILWAEK